MKKLQENGEKRSVGEEQLLQAFDAVISELMQPKDPELRARGEEFLRMLEQMPESAGLHTPRIRERASFHIECARSAQKRRR